MSTINLKYRTPKSLFDFVLTIDDSISRTIECKPLTMNPFIYGNDEIIDTVIFPGSVSIDFTILTNVGFNSAADSLYFELNSSLAFHDTTVEVLKDDSEFFYGYVNKKNIKSNYETKSFGLEILSDFGKLKDVNPKVLDYEDYTSAPHEGKVLLTDLLLKLIQEAYPSLNTVILNTDIYSQTNFPDLLAVDWIASAQYFGAFNYDYIGAASRYNNAAEIVRDVLNIFAAVGVLIGDTFYVVSRFYFTQTTQTIYRREYVQDLGPKHFYSSAIKGLQVLVRPAGTYLTYEHWYGGVIKQISYKDLSGNFIIGETISWADGSAEILDYYGEGTTGTMLIKNISVSNGLASGETFTGSSSGATAKQSGNNYSLQNSEEVETLENVMVGGDPPGIDGTVYPLLVRNIWILVPGFVAGLGNEQWITSVRNSFYITGGTQKALWKCVADKLWDLISQNRIVYETDVKGIDWSYNKYYVFENSTLKLRPRKISYDHTNDTTKIELIQG